MGRRTPRQFPGSLSTRRRNHLHRAWVRHTRRCRIHSSIVVCASLGSVKRFRGRSWSTSYGRTASATPGCGSCSPDAMVAGIVAPASGGGWQPALAADPERGWAEIQPGMHFHDLRHTHMTWLLEDEVTHVLQLRRLGHSARGHSRDLLARDRGHGGDHAGRAAAAVGRVQRLVVGGYEGGAGRAPPLLPKMGNGLPVMITNRPSDQLKHAGGRYWD